MAQSERLALLKTDLGLFGALPEELAGFLSAKLAEAEDMIAREGVALAEDSAADDALVAGFAAWLYRRRAGAPDDPMPRMLRWEINNRIMGGAMGRGKGGESG